MQTAKFPLSLACLYERHHAGTSVAFKKSNIINQSKVQPCADRSFGEIFGMRVSPLLDSVLRAHGLASLPSDNDVQKMSPAEKETLYDKQKQILITEMNRNGRWNRSAQGLTAPYPWRVSLGFASARTLSHSLDRAQKENSLTTNHRLQQGRCHKMCRPWFSHELQSQEGGGAERPSTDTATTSCTRTVG